jgi:hypothetical protein
VARALRNALSHWRMRYRAVFGSAVPDPRSGAEVLAHLRDYARAAPEQIDVLAMDAERKANLEAYLEHVARVRMYRQLQGVLAITDDQIEAADQRLREIGVLMEG